MTQAANLGALGTNAGTTGILPIAGGGTAGTGGAIGFKNRIINGNMSIDQRNAGAAITFAGGVERKYTVDRWGFVYFQNSKFTGQQNLNSVTPPAGFVNYFGLQTAATFTVGTTEVFTLSQLIEGYNVADLNWGTANAKTITLSFWVRSSLTGTFGGALLNSAGNRSYPFSYTINSANTWEYETITIAGDTSGTWLNTNGCGVRVDFSLASGATYSGTAGAWTASEKYSVTGATTFGAASGQTFYITGCQFEVGTAATNFDFRSIGTELGLCQRYYQVYSDAANSNYTFIWSGSIPSATSAQYLSSILIPMRAAPTGTVIGTNSSSMGTPGISTTTPSFARFSASGASADSRAYFQLNASFSAEL